MIKVLTYQITTTFNSPYGAFQAGYYIQVYFDESTETYSADLTADYNGASIISGSLSLGPNLFYGDGGAVTRVFPSSSSNLYQFCDGTTLKYTRTIPGLPYAALGLDLNSSLCTLSPVCNLLFDAGRTIITATTGPSTTDGSFSVFAYSSNGTVKYYLDDVAFDYATQGQTSGNFANKSPGTYIVYAKDGLGGCIDSITIIVPVTKQYGIRWKMEYSDLNSMGTRLEILERAFEGDVTEICAGGTPVVISHFGNENDPYQSIVTSSLEMQLLTELNQEDKYDDIFGADDRKYLIKFFKNTGETLEPIPVPDIDPLTLPEIPTLSGMSDFFNDAFSGGVNSWGTGPPFTLGLVSLVGPSTPQSTKYFMNDFVASAGYTYTFNFQIQYITTGTQSFVGVFEVALFNSSNVVVGLYQKSRNVSVSGSPTETYSVIITPTDEVAYIGVRITRTTPATSLSFQLVDLSFTSWDATTLTTSADIVFVTGSQYSFDYEISSSSNAGVITIDVVDDSFTVLLPSFILTGTAGTYTGNYTFIAPAGATKIRITATDGSVVSFEIISFDRIPLPVEGGDGYTLEWTGYVIPQFNTNPDLLGPYPTKVTATDGLADLKNYDFLDTSGNDFKGDISVIKILSEMLSSTSLGINIRSCANVFDSGMGETSNDDPLLQAFVKADIFYSSADEPKDCEYVVKSVLEPFGARLFQSNGVWWIERIEYSVSTTKTYREFDFKGEYVGFAVSTVIKHIYAPTVGEEFVWKDRSQTITYNQNYGKFLITHDLSKDGNLIDEGRFEKKDLQPTPGGQFFNNWNIFIGQNGMTYGLQNVDSDNSTGALYVNWNPDIISTPQNDSYIYSNPVPIELDPGDSFKVFFDVSAIPNYVVRYLRIAWRMVIVNNDNGDKYEFKPSYGSNTQYEINPLQDVKNNIFIEDFNEFKTIELGPFGLNNSIHNATVQLFFYFHNHAYRDFQTLAGLRALGTAGIGDQRVYTTDGTNTYYYKTAASTAPESIPQIIRPDDYDVSTNPVEWLLQESYFLGQGAPLTKQILFDNVKISTYILSDGVLLDPPQNAVYTKIVNQFSKSTLSKPVFLGDTPEFNNSPEVYNGYFRLDDGTPTQNWHRHGITEQKLLLEILNNDLATQLSEPCKKLSGSGRAFSLIRYINWLLDNGNTDRYCHTNMVFDDKNCYYNVNLVNIKTGDDGEPPVDLSSFSLGFSLGYEA